MVQNVHALIVGTNELINNYNGMCQTITYEIVNGNFQTKFIDWK